MNIYKELAKFKGIKYYDEPHVYIIDGQQLTSGTAFVGEFKEKFDSQGLSVKSAKKKGVSVEEILADWEFKGDFSCTTMQKIIGKIKSFLLIMLYMTKSSAKG